MHYNRFLTAIALSLLCGCADRPTFFANPDPELNKTKDEFRADASNRVYPDAAPRTVDLNVRAQAAYQLRRIEVVNFSGQPLDNVELWVNRQYVCFIPHMPDRQLKEIAFTMLRDRAGQPLHIDKTMPMVQTVEIYHGGKLYAIACQNADS